ncbi:MAG: FecR family protein [Mucilaginibacter sp.]
MEESELKDLLERYRTGKATPEDKAFLESWYLTHNSSAPFEMEDEERAEDVNSVWALIQPDNASSKNIYVWYRFSAAAIVLFIISLGGYFLLLQKKQVSTHVLAKNDVAPGKNKATLTLADGKKVVLSDAANGKLVSEGGVAISKTQNGKIIYIATAIAAKPQGPAQFNELETTKGEQYQVVLPDGSHVWLNAASSLKYPVAFTGRERLVELNGEAYFEVAHNKAMPFKVKTPQQIVEDLGTHFDVSAYSDERITATTLIEGSVKITSIDGHKNILIKPGQQSAVDADGINVREVDTDGAIAWKNGYFQLDDENLESFMRKVSRWYNVEVIYKDNAPKSLLLSGTVSKYGNVSEIIHVLELTGKVHFQVENNRIIVTG